MDYIICRVQSQNNCYNVTTTKHITYTKKNEVMKQHLSLLNKRIAVLTMADYKRMCYKDGLMNVPSSSFPQISLVLVLYMYKSPKILPQ